MLNRAYSIAAVLLALCSLVACTLNLPQSITAPADIPVDAPVDAAIDAPVGVPIDILPDLSPDAPVATEPAPTATALPTVEANDNAAEQEIEELPIVEIPLRDLDQPRRAEFSGLAWYGNRLVLLTQFPHRRDNQLYYLDRDELLLHLTTGTPRRVRVHPFPIRMGDLMTRITGFEGFEAIAISGERVYFTIEARSNGRMEGYLIAGEIEPDMSEVRLDLETIVSITPQANIRNMADEAVVLAGDEIFTIFESNDLLVNFTPVVHRFGVPGLQPQGTLPFPHVAYRITDATPLDGDGRFWAINAFYSEDLNIRLGLDLLTMKYGEGATHQKSTSVERLVQFQYSPNGITLVERPPVQLQLLDDVARNWEGIALLETPEATGFLLVTDRQPTTILAFVEYPLP